MWWQEITQRLPVGGLLITDMGFYGFEWFDTLTEQGKYVLTRHKAKVRYQVVRVLSSSSHYKDEIIQNNKSVICIADVGELRMHFYSQNGYWVYLISGLAALMVYRCFFFATWIFYAVLNDLCADVAIALQQPNRTAIIPVLSVGNTYLGGQPDLPDSGFGASCWRCVFGDLRDRPQKSKPICLTSSLGGN